MNLKNMKIGARLGVAFAAILGLLVIISFTAIYKMSTMHAVTDTLVNQDFVEARLATDALDSVRGSIARVFEIVANTNEDSVKEARERLKSNTTKFDESISQLEAMIHTSDGREIIDKIKDSRNRYVASYEKVLAMVGSNRDDASKLAFGDTYKELHNFADNLRTMVEHQQNNFTKMAS